METTIVALKPKPIPLDTKQQSKSTPPPPKLIDKTAFPKKVPRGTRPEKRKSSYRKPTNKFAFHPAPIELPKASLPQLPRVSVELERQFRELELSQKDLVQQVKKRGELEYLAVSLDSSGQYWIAVEGTGKPFIRQQFATPEFCYEAALELEDTFDILQVIEVRPPETIERIEEMVEFYLDRERVLLAWD